MRENDFGFPEEARALRSTRSLGAQNGKYTRSVPPHSLVQRTSLRHHLRMTTQMKRAALLKFTINELGVYSLTPHDGPDLDCKPLDPTERITLDALCKAVNDGMTDDAVYAALRANLETLEAIEALGAAAVRADAAARA